MDSFQDRRSEKIMLVNTVKLMMGTNVKNGKQILKGQFGVLSWWSDNLETLAHYYEGYAIEITVKIDPKLEMEYVRYLDKLEEIGCSIEEYTYGFIDVICPIGAIWYSFGKDYLEKNIVEIKEIFPDLSSFYEEE
jgi:hypothetical protein